MFSSEVASFAPPMVVNELNAAPFLSVPSTDASLNTVSAWVSPRFSKYP